MGQLISGINGHIRGKIGTVIGSSWKGIPYLKGPYSKRTGKAGPEETGNRNKFALAHFWLRPVLGFVRVGLKDYTPTVEGFNAAKSLLLLHAFEGVAPDRHINPALAKLSVGTLALSPDMAVAKTVQGQLAFTWDPGVVQEGHAKGAVENKFEWGGDFGSPDETYLSSQFEKPVMVHRYPAKIKAFYMEPDPQRPDLALCVDVLAPEGYGEIIGGSQRMASYELLVQRIREHNLPEEAFKWYLDLRKYGSVPHGGFGMGIERAVAWICGLEHVRETIPFARMLNRLYP